MSLKSRLIVLFLLVGLVPVLVVGILNFYNARQSMEYEVYKAMNMYSQLSGNEIVKYFREREIEARVLASSQDVAQSMNLLRDLDWDTTATEWVNHEDTLTSYSRNAARELGFVQLFITDLNGEVVFDSVGWLSNSNLSDHAYIRQALGGNASWSDIYYLEELKNNVLILSTPIFDTGTFIRNLSETIGTLNILVTERTIAQFIHDGLTILGETTDAFLVNPDGLLLTDTLTGDYSSDASLKVTINTRPVELLREPILSNDTDFLSQAEYRNHQGNMVLGTAQVTMLGHKPVGLVVEIDHDEAFASVTTMRNFMLIVGACVVIIMALIGSFVSNGIARPVQEVAEVAGQIAYGDFTVQTEVTRRDEIGKLSGAFNYMSQSLSSLISQAVEMATSVREGTAAVSAASEDMSSSLESASASTNEFAFNAQNLSASSLKMAETNTRILNRAEEGNKAVKDVIWQMELINRRVKELQEVIAEVDRRSDNISQILNVITDIAEQTNLLALNAAIEAARAGEQGRGFAVVADEVRKLAEQSTNAAKEISELIAATQEESKKALENMNQGVRDVEAGTEVVSRTGATFTEILSDVSEIAKQVEETAYAAQELSAGSEEMAASVQEQASTMEEVSSTAEELHASAERLFNELQKFKYR